MENKHKPPLSRVIREGTYGTCPVCHSTESKKYNFLFFSFGKILGCINPDCEKYYKRKIDTPEMKIEYKL